MANKPIRLLDDTPVAARHIVRADQYTTGAVQVLPGHWWAPAAVDGLDGDQGWVSATVERRLSDHGLLSSLSLPNAAGPDGIEHRNRFAVNNAERPQPGDEWIEFTDKASQRPIAVVSPSNAQVNRSTVTVSGIDAAGLCSGWREGKIAAWTPSAPQDVIDWYSQAPHAVLAHDFTSAGHTGWTVSTSGGGTVSSGSSGTTLLSAPTSGSGFARVQRSVMTSRAPGWTVEWDLEPLSVTGNGFHLYGLDGSGGTAWAIAYSPVLQAMSISVGAVTVTAASPPPKTAEVATFGVYARDGWITFVRDGMVIGSMRRAATGNDLASLRVGVAANSGIGIGSGRSEIRCKRMRVQAIRPFLRRGAPATDYRLPGNPPPGGLTGDYHLVTSELASMTVPQFAASILTPFAEPYQSRIDPTVQFSGSTWMPPGPPNGEGLAVRWHGAIYLDLASYDLQLGLQAADDMARVWVGSTRADRIYTQWWAGATHPGVSLRSWLGTDKPGWFPIVVEYANTTGNAAINLVSSTNGGSTWTTVGAHALSPYGTWSGDVAGESHREIIDQACVASGLQWRTQPKTLESGEFPARLEFGRPLGLQTDYELTEIEATEYMVDVDATEVTNRIHGDGAGLGRSDGADQGLTVEMLDPAATSDPWLTTRYEQLQEISERSLMQQRLDSLLALYSSPHEQVAARPRGTEDMVYEWGDSFPTSGPARQLLWEPGDGIRLTLPSVGVNDRTPRQLASVQQVLRPAGRLPPVVGFRQRPRHLRERLRTLSRQSAVARRNYQGQLAQIAGSIGGGAGFGGLDVNTRLLVAASTVVTLEVVVYAVTGSGTLTVNGVSTGITVNRPGRYNVTPWLATSTLQHATIAGASGQGTQLVATVTV